MGYREQMVVLAGVSLIAGACLCTRLGPIGPALEPTPDSPPLLEPSSTPRDIPTAAPTMTGGGSAEEAIAAVDVPVRDRYDLAARLLGKTGIPTQIAPAALPVVGDVETFHIENDDTQNVVDVRARLAYAGEHVAMWFEEGANFDPAAIRAVGERFDQKTYPTNHAFFGSEPNPGIDGDPRVHVLNTTQLGSGIAGYFYSPSLYPASIVPYSNEKEIIYLNLNAVTPETPDYYDAVLAHEFQHMIHYNVDRNEESWVNEGLSEVAATLNGYGVSDFASSLLDDPGTQLNSWPEEDDKIPHYGAGYLFHMYFLDRFGQDAMRALVARPENGLQAVDATLQELGAGTTADEVFADWRLANLLNDASIAEGQYAYKSIRLDQTARITERFTQFPVSRNMEVNQYGTQYFELRGPARLAISFQGGTQVGAIPTSVANTDGDPATADSAIWWSNRVDDSDTTLTREIDLTGVTAAALDFDLWHAIEDRWDYGYVEASTDGGQAWTILRTPGSTDDNPHGNAYGPGFTGLSADLPGANADGWAHQTVDLADYAGQKILIRFEYISDDATIQPGMAVDNICVKAIGFCDNVENGAGDWDARGFARIDNLLAQRFLIQIVQRDSDGKIVATPFALDNGNAGETTIEIGSDPATLVISGLTRFTTEPALYHLEISVAR